MAQNRLLASWKIAWSASVLFDAENHSRISRYFFHCSSSCCFSRDLDLFSTSLLYCSMKSSCLWKLINVACSLIRPRCVLRLSRICLNVVSKFFHIERNSCRQTKNAISKSLQPGTLLAKTIHLFLKRTLWLLYERTVYPCTS